MRPGQALHPFEGIRLFPARRVFCDDLHEEPGVYFRKGRGWWDGVERFGTNRAVVLGGRPESFSTGRLGRVHRHAESRTRDFVYHG